MTANILRTSEILRSTVSTKRLKNIHRAKKMLTVLDFVFMMCVIPADLFQVCYYTYFMIEGDPFNNNYEKAELDLHTTKILIVANTFLQLLQISNSVWNTVIYSRMQENVRKTVYLCCVKLTCFLVKQKTPRNSFVRV